MDTLNLFKEGNRQNVSPRWGKAGTARERSYENGNTYY